jgi:hypothetical protein
MVRVAVPEQDFWASENSSWIVSRTLHHEEQHWKRERSDARLYLPHRRVNVAEGSAVRKAKVPAQVAECEGAEGKYG